MPMWVEIPRNPLNSVLNSSHSDSCSPNSVGHVGAQGAGSGGPMRIHGDTMELHGGSEGDGWRKVQGDFRPKHMSANTVEFACPFQWQALDF